MVLSTKPKSCEGCPLYEKGKGFVYPVDVLQDIEGRIKSFGFSEAVGPVILLQGEAPGSKEIATGKPFVGDAGHWLRRNILRMAGIRDDEAVIDNTIRCLLNGKSGAYPTGKDRKAAEKHCRQYDLWGYFNDTPLMLLGAKALEQHGLKNISKVHGSIIREGDRLVGMTFHPSAVMRSPNLLPVVVREIYNLVRAAKHPELLFRPKVHKGYLPFVPAPMVFDLEWNPYTGEISAIGIAFDKHEAYSVFGDAEVESIKRHPSLLIGHNIIDADFPMMAFSDYELSRVRDTRILAHLVHAHMASEFKKTVDDAKNPLGMGLFNLGSLVRFYRPTEDWKADTADLLEYNGRDCAYTYGLYEDLMQDIKAQGQEHLILEQHKLAALCVKMNAKGIKVDKEKVISYVQEKTLSKKPLEEAIPFNPRSVKQIKEYAKTVGIAIKDTKYETLLKYEGENETFDKLIEFKEDSKSMKTWFPLEFNDEGNVVDCEEFIYPHFNPTGTNVDRLSCSNPNLQNLTNEGDREIAGGRIKRMPPVRRFFIPRNPDEYIISCDYSQIEDWTVAVESEDTVLLSDLQSGRDIHRITAANYFSRLRGTTILPEDIEKKSKERYKGKQTNHQAKYGITPHYLAKLMYGKATKEAINEARGLLDVYFGRYKGVMAWQRRVSEAVEKDCRVRNKFGRLRYIYAQTPHERMKRACHFLGCSPGARIVNRAAIAVYEEMGLVPDAIVHDELVFEGPLDLEWLKKIKAIMERPITEMEGIVIPVNVAVGKNYKELEEVKFE